MPNRKIPTYLTNGNRVKDRSENRVLAGVRKGTMAAYYDTHGEIFRAHLLQRAEGSDEGSPRLWPVASHSGMVRELVDGKTKIWQHKAQNPHEIEQIRQAQLSVIESIVEEAA